MNEFKYIIIFGVENPCEVFYCKDQKDVKVKINELFKENEIIYNASLEVLSIDGKFDWEKLF